MADPKRVGAFPFRKLSPQDRSGNFAEVQQPYSEEEARREAERCLLCGTPVCIDACPVLLDVRGMNQAVAEGDYNMAYERIRETNPLLGVTARCCPQLQGLCEDACVLRWLGQPIGIGLVQKFVADWAAKNNQLAPPPVNPETGKRVAIVGAGPAGLAAAEMLRRYGHGVTLYETLNAAGGTALYGIPDYHLPKHVLSKEIESISRMGVRIATGIKIGEDTTLSQIREESDAVLITAGSKDTRKINTPGADLAGVIDGYRFLFDVYVDGVENYARNPKYELGKEIVVIGGGDSALDCARTALRLSGGKVTIAYRRTESEMPADPVMLEEAKEEGVKFMFLSQPGSYEGKDGKITSVRMNTMQLGPPDETGRKRPEPIEGKEFQIECSCVLLALGRGPDSFLSKKAGLQLGKNNAIVVDSKNHTSEEGVFAAGDVITGETLVVKAMASGREAAQRVHEYLLGIEDQHVSLYERYYKENSYKRMTEGGVAGPLPE